MGSRTLFAVLLAAVAATTAAEPAEPQTWAISIDNDFFLPIESDRDYTAGSSITYAGRPGLRYWKALDASLGWLDRLTALDQHIPDMADYTPAIELGVYGFTPDHIMTDAIVRDDRPYASLVYLSNSRSYNDRLSGDGWTTTLTLGVLGLDVFEGGQILAHKLTGSEKAEGWEHQVSNGGELTGRYSLAFHDYIRSISKPSRKLKATYYASAGYLTEVGVALTLRDGLISSPDNRFNPELTAYGERIHESGESMAKESYFWGGIALKARAYNAFLEGQFRDSDYTIPRNDIRKLLAEVWLGYTYSLSRGYKISYVARGQTSELKNGEGDRTIVWGGLVFSRTLF